jgi:hypothetical protein
MNCDQFSASENSSKKQVPVYYYGQRSHIYLAGMVFRRQSRSRSQGKLRGTVGVNVSIGRRFLSLGESLGNFSNSFF